MVFQLSQAALDIVSGFATVTALDTPPPGPGSGPPKMVQAHFPFTPPTSEAQELSLMVKEAKVLFQKAINDLGASVMLEACVIGEAQRAGTITRPLRMQSPILCARSCRSRGNRGARRRP